MSPTLTVREVARLANAGGIVAGAHSMDMRYSPFTDPDDIFAMISTKLRANAAAVLAEAKRTEETPHTAAQRLAQRRVLDAVRLRGKLAIDTIPEPHLHGRAAAGVLSLVSEGRHGTYAHGSRRDTTRAQRCPPHASRASSVRAGGP